MSFLTIFVIVILALVILALKYSWIWKKQKKQYAEIQSGRATLSDKAFCEKLALDVSFVRIVSTIRSKISEFGRYDPLRVYPDDKFYPHFGLNHDDDVAMLVQEMKVIEGYREYSFPLEEVKTVGDFVKIVLRLKKEFEGAKVQQP